MNGEEYVTKTVWGHDQISARMPKTFKDGSRGVGASYHMVHALECKYQNDDIGLI